MTEFIHPTYGRLICAYRRTFNRRPMRVVAFESECFNSTTMADDHLALRAAEAGAKIIWPDKPGLAQIVKAETARDVLVRRRDRHSGPCICAWCEDAIRAIALIDSGNAGGPTT